MSGRRLSWDWYDGEVPPNVKIHEDAYVETSFSFRFFRSERSPGVEYGRGASSYLGTMFDIGPQAHVRLGDFTLVHGARIICDSEILIGDYTLISWNVLLMDTYRVPRSIAGRRSELEALPGRELRIACAPVEARPVRIESKVWIGFDSCILPGVTVGEGSIVGARSVVVADVPPFTIVAGNPARVVRELTPEERHAA